MRVIFSAMPDSVTLLGAYRVFLCGTLGRVLGGLRHRDELKWGLMP
jgi:hypothetical protein